ncbi:hypothetical protein CEXT_119461 [Caerostris extrusa]|uniref:Uncharacterized protein n=1 Tax=Caerostris extrusa TaxID=172846 RepID=A0AAV4N756_CAEEX|nr:hypothetical protein CEXT_119461 [Caerostris extrusa]
MDHQASQCCFFIVFFSPELFIFLLLLLLLGAVLLLRGKGGGRKKKEKLPVFGRAWLRMRDRSRPERSTGLYGALFYPMFSYSSGRWLGVSRCVRPPWVRNGGNKLKQYQQIERE